MKSIQIFDGTLEEFKSSDVCLELDSLEVDTVVTTQELDNGIIIIKKEER